MRKDFIVEVREGITGHLRNNRAGPAAGPSGLQWSLLPLGEDRHERLWPTV